MDPFYVDLIPEGSKQKKPATLDIFVGFVRGSSVYSLLLQTRSAVPLYYILTRYIIKIYKDVTIRNI